MNLFQKLKTLFASERLPQEDRKIYAQAKNLPDLLEKLHENILHNEVLLRQTKGTISKLELTERATITSLKRGNIQGRSVRLALQTVHRYRKQLDLLMNKADILNRNLNLNINLVGKIQVSQAMEMKGLSPELIDQVILDFSENVEKYQEDVVGSESNLSFGEPQVPENERQELQKIEEEIFGEAQHFKSRSQNYEIAPSAAKREEGVEPLPSNLEDSEDIMRRLKSLEQELE